MNPKPIISVILPTYNYGHFITRAIASVISQNFSAWELIIIDDGSTDDTAAIVKTFKDERIMYHKNLKNMGTSFSWNMGVSLSLGSNLCILSADDELPQGALEKRLSHKNKTGSSIVHTGLMRIVGETQSYIAPLVVNSSKDIKDFISGKKTNTGINNATFLVDKKLIELAGPRHTQTGVTAHQDYEYALRLLSFGKASSLDENTYNYHIHKASWLSRTGNSNVNNKYLEEINEKYLKIFSI
jgi:glycosyltransferase involved in cell wall biosynthesis